MNVEYDSSADAVYIRLADSIDHGGVAWTYPCDPVEVKGMINLDFDREGRLIGIEIMGAAKKLPPEVLRGETT